MGKSRSEVPGDWLGVLHRSHRFSLERFFRRRAPDLQSDSDDLVQEVFLRIAQRKSGEDIENPRHYMFRTAAHVLTDFRRRRSTRMADAHIEFQEYDSQVDEVSSPERVYTSRQELAQVGMALEELGEKVRVAFVLHRFEDLTYREIAVRMGVSVSSVEKYIMQALVHLTERLERDA